MPKTKSYNYLIHKKILKMQNTQQKEIKHLVVQQAQWSRWDWTIQESLLMNHQLPNFSIPKICNSSAIPSNFHMTRSQITIRKTKGNYDNGEEMLVKPTAWQNGTKMLKFHQKIIQYSQTSMIIFYLVLSSLSNLEPFYLCLCYFRVVPDDIMGNLLCILLTKSYPMHSFSTPWKHQ